MDYKSVEKKWQNKWSKIHPEFFDKSKMDKKLYVMDMFSYPSGAQLHLGHWFNFGLVDSWARFKKLQGYNVFQPMGFDAFGLPAENYAIKTGVHPYDSTMMNIQTMRRQLKEMGGMFNWDSEIVTCTPDYYKWTQWLFLVLYKNGLVYKKEAPVNWCPSCRTVLANEQVINGKCERCGTEVYLKKLSQWFIKTTAYAEELIDKLDELDWPEKTKSMQKNWIGKSDGAIINFKICDSQDVIEVFTTRPETIFGATYIVMAPEHSLVSQITTKEQLIAVNEYVDKCQFVSEIDRQSTEREKTGVFTGAYAINLVNNKKIPIWISDYVLDSYGTGAVMAVPAHDSRDYDFAKKYQLDIIEVVEGENTSREISQNGSMINSDFLNGYSTEEARNVVISYLESCEIGKRKTNYKMRDWLVSRQRYWGAPIPIVYCEKCGIVPVPEKDLPVKLPYDVDFTPTGESPLAKCDEFINTTCPCCGGKAKREADTMDTFMCSSWYQFRYVDANNDEEAFNKNIVNRMFPVDKYVGGIEHACMHLIYSRFMTKALRDAGYLNFDEPFQSLIHQGTILGPDGQKMSKSRGNTVSPDAYIDKYGSDVFRTYLMFGFNYFEGGPWSDSGIIAISKFYSKLERCYDKYFSITEFTDLYDEEEKELERVFNISLKRFTDDFEQFHFNTAIARMMEICTALSKYLHFERNSKVLNDIIPNITIMLAPCAPHIAEEYWEKLGNNDSIFFSKWPDADEQKMQSKIIKIPVQINSKVKCVIDVEEAMSEEEIRDIARNKIKKFIPEGKKEDKYFYVPKKIINFVIK